jgi:hypothetical protein
MTDTQAYQGAADSSSALSDFASLSFHIEQALAAISTGSIVAVKTAPYDAAGNPLTPGSGGPIGFVDVHPLVNQVNGLGVATPHDTIYRLSYIRYQGGNGAFITDPCVDDIGWMSVSDRDTSIVRATGKQANPGSLRQFSKADGVYVGCVIAGSPSQYFAWTISGFRIVATGSGDIVAPGGLNMTAPTVVASGNLAVGTGATGTFTAASGQIVTVIDGIITNIF